MRLMKLVDTDTELEVIVDAVPVDDTAYRFGEWFDHHRIPLSVIKALAVPVHTTDDRTEAWFRQTVAAPSVGVQPVLVMFEAKELGRIYVFYYHHPGINLIIVDWTLLDRAVTDPKVTPVPTLPTAPALATTRSDTNVFDRVMDHRKRKPAPEPRPQMNAVQLDQAVAKSVMSGLRIRGMSAADDHAKQLYQITVKAATFSLKRHKRPVSVAEIQDVVERLLEILAD